MDTQSCLWCGQSFAVAIRPGPRPRYCRSSHRQRAYEERRRSAQDGEGTRSRPASGSGDGETGVVRPRERGRAALSIKILGPVEVVGQDGNRISLTRGLRGLLATLALRPGQVVSVESLIDDIWPNVSDEIARHRLHTAVWKLRALLRSEEKDSRQLITWSPPGYVLDVTEDQLDWTRFRRLRDAGERALARGAPGPAKSYLSAALALWAGNKALIGIDVSADDLGFIAEQSAGRERAVRSLIEARVRLGEQVIPELEAHVGNDPLDHHAVSQLAVAYHRSSEVARALEVCARYLRRASEDGDRAASSRIARLQTAILRGDPEIDSTILEASSNSRPRPTMSGQRAFLSSAWAPFTPSPAGPLPAELHLIMEELGGFIHETTESSVDASFPEVEPAVEAAIALERTLGRAPFARTGIEVQLSVGATATLEGPRRARARLLAAAARPGQILVSGAGNRVLRPVLPPEVRLRSLGSHRLNALSPPTPVFQLTAPSLPAVRAAPRWFDQGAVHNLARDPFRLIGRDREVMEITRRLGEVQLVTLVGAPGSGKTSLAAHVASGLSGDYRDGVWFVPLQPISHPGLVATAIAEVLRMPGSAAAHLDVLVRYLRDKHALVVLDNCEHLLGECRELVDGLLPGCPGVSVFATSREALHSRLENVVSVTPLQPPTLGSPADVRANAAVRLFIDRFDSQGAGGADGDIDAVARICRAVEGIPLALVLAAARARDLGTLPLADVLEDTLGEGQGLKFLSRAGAGTDGVGDTLDQALEWSYHLLGERERALFDALSVFRSGFALDDVRAVCASHPTSHADVLADLNRLVQASLVTRASRGGSSPRFRLLQPVRDFAAAKLADGSRRADALRCRHAEHFLAVAEEAEPRVRGRQDRATLDRLDATLPDMYAAIRWAVAHREARIALRMVGALWAFWLVRGRMAEGRELIEAVLDLDPTPSAERIKALIAYSQLVWFGGDFARTRAACRESLALAEALGDDFGYAWGPLGLAAVEMLRGDDDLVPLRVEETLAGFRALGNDWDTGQALQTLGGAAWHRGRYDRAEAALSESVALYRTLGHPTLMASLLAHGLVLALLGNVDGGAKEVDESIVISYEAGDQLDLNWGLCHRGAIARYGGHHDEARRYFREALAMARDIGGGWSIQWALDGLASTEDLVERAAPERVAASVQLLARVEVMAREMGLSLAPREREYHAADLKRARAALGERAFAAAFARGERLRLDEAIEFALSLEDPRPLNK
jgi:predicted ATPase/DNA-binding SARP family transcriptional activator